MGKYDELVEGLNKTAKVLRIQADLARRIANTYEPERERWEAEKGDDRLTAMVRYQIEQEQLAKSLSKDAEEAEQAATAITALQAELAAMKARMEELDRPLPQEHWTTKGAIRSARELIKAADALCFAAETSGGTAGHDGYLSAAIANWAAEREKHKQVLRIIELEGHSPEIGAGVPTNLFAKP